MLGPHAKPQQVAELRQELGRNDPLPVQYGRHLWSALHGDLGRSFRGQMPVLREILGSLPSTVV